MNREPPGHKLRRARIALIRNDKAMMERPHLLAVRRVEVFDDPNFTAATNGVELFLGVTWMEKLTQDEMCGVLMHEMRHRMLKHPIRWRPLFERARSVYGNDLNEEALHTLHNMATDMQINRDLLEEGWTLPRPGCFDYRNEYRGWSSDRIFMDLLKKAADAQKNGGPPMQGAGWGMTLPLPGDADKRAEQKNGPGSAPDTKGGYDAAATPEQARDEEQRIDQLNQEGVAMAKKRGLLPGSAKQIIKASTRTPAWPHRLASEINRIRGADEYTMARMSNAGRRNRMVMPGTISYSIEHIVFAVDTSGSISERELNAYLKTINAIVRSENPERITLMQCDARVQDVAELQGEVPSITVKGRGGTAFQPVFDHLATAGIVPTILVYLTDGCGDTPKDPGYSVVWVTTDKERFPFGSVIPIHT